MVATKEFTGVIDETNNRMKQIEVYKNKPITDTAQKIGFVAMVVGAILVASMFVLHILTGIFALVMMAITAVCLWWGWSFVKRMDPIVQQKAKNSVLKRMVDEARKNAKYQLDNQVLDRKARLTTARAARDKMGALVQSMKDKIAASNPESPSVEKMKSILVRIEAAYETVCENLDKAKIANAQFEQKVQEYKDMDEFSVMAGEAMAVFDNTNNDKLQEMLSLEAFKAIDSDFNTAIISIENSARDMEGI